MFASLLLLLLPPLQGLTPAEADTRFLQQRVEELARVYDDHASTQSTAAEAQRSAVVRELAHLPLRDQPREEAGKLLARVVSGDRSYRVRAAAAVAIGNVGTDVALRAVVEALFGREGRSRRYALMHTVFGDVVAQLHHPDDIDWLDAQILQPRLRGVDSFALRAAGSLRDELVVSALDGVATARLRGLAPRCAEVARRGPAAQRAAALRVLAALEWPDSVVAEALRDEDPAVRAAAALHPGLGPEEVALSLADPAAPVRRAALDRIAARPPAEAVPLLLARLEAETATTTRLWVCELLHRATGKDFGGDLDLWRSWWSAQADRFEGPEEVEQSGRTYFFELGLRTEGVTFVIDVSASMEREDESGRSRVARAADELEKALGTLPAGARFRVIAFASDVRSFPELREAPVSRVGANAAMEWFRSLKPAGATNTYGALMTALTDPVRPDTIVLLSDGNPYRCAWQGETWSEHEQILAEVARVNADKRVRIHTVALLGSAQGLGEDEDVESAARFLALLAARNDGDFREIR